MLNAARPTMECARCHNLLLPMVLDRDESGLGWLWAWRCFACGNVIDSLILQHRHARPRGHQRDRKRRIVNTGAC